MSGALLVLLLAQVADPDPAATEPPGEATESVQRSPGFTQDRQFTNARLWVLDTGHYTIEQAWSGSWGVPGALAGAAHQDDQLLQTGFAMGIVPHLEIDLSANVDLDQDGNGNYQISPTGLSGVSAEVRIALGRTWGQYRGNPTLDLELWGRVNEPTRLEGRLLLADQLLTPRLLATINLMFARNSFHDAGTGLDYEIKAELGWSYEVLPEILRLGAEATLGWDSHNSVDANEVTLIHSLAQVGPVILLTDPRKRVKVLAALLGGLEPWDPPWESQLVVGTTF